MSLLISNQQAKRIWKPVACFAVTLGSSFVLVMGASAARAQESDPIPSEGSISSLEMQAMQERLRSLEVELQETMESLQNSESRIDSFLKSWKEKGDPEVDVVKSQTSEKKEKSDAPKDEKKKEKKWFEKLGIRGYAQFRLNDVLSEEGAPAQHVGDRSVGDNQSFLIRRARVIIFGDVSDHLYVYLQPDFAVTTPGSTDNTHFAQIRDWYGDVYLTEDKVHRVRVGQSKIPYGWENLQSSSNRLALDRSDSINSAARNERDLGAFYYWTPEPAQAFFKEVIDNGLKGSGNYGVFGFGCYNGQGGSLQEQNDNVHIIARLTLPMRLANDQLFEASLQGYRGHYTVLSSPIQPLGVGPSSRPLGTLETGNRAGLLDERMAVTAVWYPKPFGIQCEWNVGRSPQLNDSQTAIEVGDIRGGYVMAMYKWDTCHRGTFFPFFKYNRFEGGMKAERNAPFTNVTEYEAGVEWQITDSVEWTNMVTWTDRTNTTAFASGRSYEQFEGELYRTQIQINY